MAETTMPRRRGTSNTSETPFRVFSTGDDTLLGKCRNMGDGRLSDDIYVRFGMTSVFGKFAIMGGSVIFKTTYNCTSWVTSRISSGSVASDIYDMFNCVSSYIESFSFVIEPGGTYEAKIKCRNSSSAEFVLGYVVALKRLGTYVQSLQVHYTTDSQYAGTGLLQTVSSSGYGGGESLVYLGYNIPYDKDAHQGIVDATGKDVEIAANKEKEAEHLNQASEYDLGTASNNYLEEEIKNGTTMWKTLRYIGLGVVILLLIPVVLSFFKKQKGKK